MPALSAPPSRATVVAQRVTKFHGAAPVLVDVDVTIGADHQLGIIGPNGVGKTTLLRILAGLEEPDAGKVTVAPPGATVGYLAQEPGATGGETVRQQLERRTGVRDAEARFAAAAAGLADQGPLADDEYAAALERYLALGAPDFDARTARLLDDLGVPLGLLDVPVRALSGGQRAKASLAGLLLSQFDLLLLDEPTNDLDFDGLERLESFLRTRSGGLAVVSHDRAFLEKVVTSVLEIDEHSHAATLYGGGFDAFLEARETARRHAYEAHAVYVAERGRLEARERVQRQWAVQGARQEKRRPRDNDKAQRDWRLNRTEKQASKVRITEKALERLEPVDHPHEPWRLDLDLAATARSGDVVARLEQAVVERGAWRLGPVDLEVTWAERVAVLGPNGSGKSTLIAALLGSLDLVSGRQLLGPSVVVGELGQDRARFSDGAGTLSAKFRSATGMTVPESRSLLAKFGLGAAHAERNARSLSPGERTRAELALLMARGTNLLVLDEPTNHLDLPAIEQLEEALGAWQATLILVTHDRRLLDAVTVTRRLHLDDGRLVLDEAT